jgi:hypothetical protein
MLVSRADIPFDHIATYPQEDRFLKLPIDRYISLLGIESAPPQNAVINALNNPKYRFVTACLSRRVGKTYIANIIAQLCALIPGCNILIMSPNYSLSNISFDLQRSLIKKFGLEVARDNAKDKIIELTNGSTIRMGSVNQVDSVVGRSYSFILFDEAALSEGMDAFNVSLRPTLDIVDAKGNEQSKVLFISTPRGRNNWFSELYDRGFDSAYPAWASIHATWADNPRALAADIEEARKILSSNEFAQEYMADFCVFEGQVWPFNRETCTADLSDLDIRRMDIIAGLDVGFRDPTAFCVIAYDSYDGKYYLLDEYLDNEKSTASQAAEVKILDNKYNIDYIFIDAANQQTKFDFASEHDIATINAKKDIISGIGHVENIIEGDRLIVDSKCLHSLAALDQYQWDPNVNLIKEKPIHNKYCHMADAIRYAIYTYEVNALTF